MDFALNDASPWVASGEWQVASGKEGAGCRAIRSISYHISLVHPLDYFKKHYCKIIESLPEPSDSEVGASSQDDDRQNSVFSCSSSCPR